MNPEHLNQKESWTWEWPTVPGYYWFYGWRYDWLKPFSPPVLNFIQARKDSKNLIVCSDGHIMYKGREMLGKWRRVDLPDLPELEE